MNHLDRAKHLRSHQTDAEQRLWYHLRGHRFMGLKFKRQKPLGRYIVDFICQERGLIVEVDGGQHAEQTHCDEQRDAWLRERGYRVLRFWNHEVMQQLDGVLERIRREVVAPSPPSPLPSTGEGSKEASPVDSLPHAGEGEEGDLTPAPSSGDGRGDNAASPAARRIDTTGDANKCAPSLAPRSDKGEGE